MDKLGNRPNDFTDSPWIEQILKDKAAEISPVKFNGIDVENRTGKVTGVYGRDWSQCNDVTIKRNLGDIDVD